MNDVDHLLEEWWCMSIGANKRARDDNFMIPRIKQGDEAVTDPELNVYRAFNKLEKTVFHYRDQANGVFFAPPRKTIQAPTQATAKAMNDELKVLNTRTGAMLLNGTIRDSAIAAYNHIVRERKRAGRVFTDPYTEMLARKNIIDDIVSYVRVSNDAASRNSMWEEPVIEKIDAYADTYVGDVPELDDDALHTTSQHNRVGGAALQYDSRRSGNGLHVEMDTAVYTKFNTLWLIPDTPATIDSGFAANLNKIMMPEGINGYNDDQIDVLAFTCAMKARDVNLFSPETCDQTYRKYKTVRGSDDVARHVLNYRGWNPPRVAELTNKLTELQLHYMDERSKTELRRVLSSVLISRLDHIMRGCPINYRSRSRKYIEFLSHVNYAIDFFNAYKYVLTDTKTGALPKVDGLVVWVQNGTVSVRASDAIGSALLAPARVRVLRQAFHIYVVMRLCRNMSDWVSKTYRVPVSKSTLL
jgi:hypothetical protein